MEPAIENLRNRMVKEALCDIGAGLLSLRNNLICVGVPLEAIEINNWPKFDKDDVNIKVWNGNDHLKGTGKPGSAYMTPRDVIKFIKRRQILMRRF